MSTRRVASRLLLSCTVTLCVASCIPGAGPPLLEPELSQLGQRANAPAAHQYAPRVDAVQVAAGRQIAVRDCAPCHAIDANTNGPNPKAPPLRNALWRFEEDALANHLIEAIRVGHDEMPLFDFNVIGADALIAYLRSIRSPRDERNE